MAALDDALAALTAERFGKPTPKAPPLVQASAEAIAALLADLEQGAEDEATG
jgi:hypothetical protein